MKDWWDAKHWTGPWTLWQLWLYNHRRVMILERFQTVCLRRARELSPKAGAAFLERATASVARH